MDLAQIMRILAIFFVFVSSGWCKQRYDYHQVIRVPLNNQKRETFLRHNGLRILGYVSSGMDLLVPPEKLDWVQDMFEEYEIVLPNIQDKIDEEEEEMNRLASLMNGDDDLSWFSTYHPLEDMWGWYNNLSTAYPNLVTLIPSIGTTAEGNPIMALRLNGVNSQFPKPQIWVQGLIHSREWIAGTSVQYIVYDLITRYGQDNETTLLLDTVEIIVIPIHNPDGYNYTWTTDRLWRKNRHGLGIDLNRNWDSHWGATGSSDDPTSDEYAGPYAFSELETQAVSSFFLKNNNVFGALDFHSYSELILRPAGWTLDNQPYEPELQGMGEQLVQAIASIRNTMYASTKASELYLASGIASDWFYDMTVFNNQGFRPYSYTFELSPNITSSVGFLLPPSEIIPVGEEMASAFRIFVSIAIDYPLKQEKKVFFQTAVETHEILL